MSEDSFSKPLKIMPAIVSGTILHGSRLDPIVIYTKAIDSDIAIDTKAINLLK
jgi:hypothetical protein